ncbi:phosphorylcholine transferase LicD [Gallibacterium trehalosifermentans]|uniref:Phosphorylcholine transferase LicD n=1 Tax=Gallibacterium trehalosifermentans TaxID=516935 RepID=A0ABV6H2J9_9PAST
MQDVKLAMKIKRKLTHQEYKIFLLNTLITFDKVCKDNNISYSLAYGSMLGVVRHQGFIPWDDDIDILMFREEYEKFVEIWNKSNNILKNNYELWGIDDEKNFFYGHLVKFFDKNTLLIEKTKNHLIEYGVFIDIFILEDISADAEKSNKQQKQYKLYRKLLSHFYKHGKYLNILAKKLSEKIPSIYFFMNKLENITKQERSEYVSVYAPVDKQIYKREDFNNVIYLPFEGHMFPVSAQYDNLLKQKYGDYMTLPPESERIGHKIEAYIYE